jgi:hypothetical protein
MRFLSILQLVTGAEFAFWRKLTLPKTSELQFPIIVPYTRRFYRFIEIFVNFSLVLVTGAEFAV